MESITRKPWFAAFFVVGSLFLFPALGCGGDAAGQPSAVPSPTPSMTTEALLETRLVTQPNGARTVAVSWPASTEFVPPSYRVIEYHVRRQRADKALSPISAGMPPVVGRTTAEVRSFTDTSDAHSVAYTTPHAAAFLDATASTVTEATATTYALESGAAYSYQITALVQQSPTGLYREVLICSSDRTITY